MDTIYSYGAQDGIRQVHFMRFHLHNYPLSCNWYDGKKQEEAADGVDHSGGWRPLGATIGQMMHGMVST